MKAWDLLGQTCTPDSNDMQLARRDDEYIILVNGKTLMSSRMHGSEEALASVGCRHVRTTNQPRVLVGGLGMGFTLRATLDMLPPDATVTVAELVPAVVEWNRGPLRRWREPAEGPSGRSTWGCRLHATGEPVNST